MITRFLIPCLLVLLLYSCKEDPVSPPVTPVAPANSISLLNPEVGQSNAFIRYETDCNHAERDFAFYPDTLIVTVVEESGQLFLEEYLTPKSSWYIDGTFTDTARYPITREADYLLLKERFSSVLFFFYGNDTLWLQPSPDVQLSQQDCHLNISSDPFIGEEIGFVDEFRLGELRQENKTVVSCVPVIIELDAYLFYDDDHLYVSHTIAGGNQVRGWMMLSD